MKKFNKNKLDPQLTARILELTNIAKYGKVECTAPMQLDMKNNALQHISTICGDKELMKITGVLPADPNQLDLYETVASKV
jgi:DNA-directed RNA polymerase